jgi:hypothetical protein
LPAPTRRVQALPVAVAIRRYPSRNARAIPSSSARIRLPGVKFSSEIWLARRPGSGGCQ